MVTSSDELAVIDDSRDRSGTVYLHYPCFDGLVSASIAWDFLETSKRWTVDDFRGVNYDRQRDWLATPLPPNSAVVDFLYHPDAAFWADHHGTTFLTEQSRTDVETRSRGRLVLYDRESPSCAMLMFNHLRFGLSDQTRYGEMALWANKIDSANYASVEEAVRGSDPAIEISLSLAASGGDEYRDLLLRAMRTMTLAEVASLPEVRSRAADIKQRIEAGLTSVRDGFRVESGEIVVVEATPAADSIVSRYSPYLFAPDARYSVALIHSPQHAKITAMRNPWREFESVELGAIFERFGGGGHRRVGSVIVPNDKAPDPAKALAEIVGAIRAEDSAAANAAARSTA